MPARSASSSLCAVAPSTAVRGAVGLGEACGAGSAAGAQAAAKAPVSAKRAPRRLLDSAPVPPASVVDILRELSACPTAPLHEAYVARRIVQLCRDFDLTVSSDAYGNLHARAAGENHDSPGAGGVPLVLAAHMDHPAFEVISVDPARAVLLGGVPAACFARPVRATIVRPDERIPVKVVGHEEREGGGRELLLQASEPLRADDFGVFDVGPFRETGDLLFGPAMDDLAGCAAILATLNECRRRGLNADVVGLFTRAEEVGLTGATLVARERLLPGDALVISLEASRALPGAEMGGGPVIRVGDRSGSFAPSGEALLRRAAERLSAERVLGGPVAVQ